jgi:predicted aldo/keto reductase-like oxidoreductase
VVRISTKGDDMKHQDFKQLERYPNGDIVDLYGIHHLLSKKQIDKLSDDDWSRVIEYDLELDAMIGALSGRENVL